MPDQDQAFIDRALRAVGLQPSPGDVAALADDWPALRAMADLLYEVEEAKNESPELIVDVRR